MLKKNILTVAAIALLISGCSVFRHSSYNNSVSEVNSEVSGFRATGNEPFWAVNVYFPNKIVLTSLIEGIPEKLELTLDNADRENDLSTVKYHASSNKSNLILIITRQDCTDTMKGNVSPFSVDLTLSYNGKSYNNLKGCGTYQGYYSINDIWLLKKIDGKEIEVNEPSTVPRIEFDAARNELYGYGGCNMFFGRAELNNYLLTTNHLISTKMYCLETAHIENALLNFLSNKEISYAISDNNLIMNDGETEIVFSRE